MATFDRLKLKHWIDLESLVTNMDKWPPSPTAGVTDGGSNPTTLTDGLYNTNAVHFTRANSTALVGVGATVNWSAPGITQYIWFRVTSTPSAGQKYALRSQGLLFSGTTQTYHGMWVDENMDINFWVRSPPGVTFTTSVGAGSVQLNKWHLAALRVNTTSGSDVYYSFDGSAFTSFGTLTQNAVASNGTPYIGCRSVGADHLDGDVGAIIHSVDLSSDDADWFYNGGLGRPFSDYQELNNPGTGNLVLAMDFRGESTGDPVTDLVSGQKLENVGDPVLRVAGQNPGDIAIQSSDTGYMEAVNNAVAQAVNFGQLDQFTFFFVGYEVTPGVKYGGGMNVVPQEGGTKGWHNKTDGIGSNAFFLSEGLTHVTVGNNAWGFGCGIWDGPSTDMRGWVLNTSSRHPFAVAAVPGTKTLTACTTPIIRLCQNSNIAGDVVRWNMLLIFDRVLTESEVDYLMDSLRFRTLEQIGLSTEDKKRSSLFVGLGLGL